MKKRIIANTNHINLGKRGENEVRQIVFDISEWIALYGEGTVALTHQRCGDKDPYPCVVEVAGNEALWTIAEPDVDKPGVGECELMYMVGFAKAKSVTYQTFTSKSLTDASSEVPEPHKSWVDAVIEASTGKSAYEEAVEHGFKGSEEEWLESLRGNPGKDGKDGANGKDGYTPVKGQDYFTENEKQEIVQETIESLPDEIKKCTASIVDGVLILS